MRKQMVTLVVDWDNPPKISAEREAELKALAERPDSAIDYSDIPPLDDKVWKNAMRNPLFHSRPKIK